MRALPVCLLALMLSGCSMLSRSPVEPVQSTATAPAKTEPAKPKAVRPAPVRIYTDASALVGNSGLPGGQRIARVHAQTKSTLVDLRGPHFDQMGKTSRPARIQRSLLGQLVQRQHRLVQSRQCLTQIDALSHACHLHMCI